MAIYMFAVGFLYAPVVVLIVFSFNDSPLPVFPLRGFTFRWYDQLFENSVLKAAVMRSLEIAVISSGISVVLGLTATIALVRSRVRARIAVLALLLSPLVIPTLVFGISLLVLFLTLDIEPSLKTVIIGHVVVTVPFTILVLMPRMMTIQQDLEEAAFDLGASRLRVVWSIDLPLLGPALVSAFVLGFTLSFDEYAIASFIAGTDATLPVYLYSSLRFATRLPEVIAAAAVILTVSLALVAGVEMWRRGRDRRYGAAAG